MPRQAIIDQNGRDISKALANVGGVQPSNNNIEGNIVTSWSYVPHMGNILGLLWRILVSGSGRAIVMLSATGVYVW